MEASDLTPGGAALGAFNVFGLFYFEKLIHRHHTSVKPAACANLPEWVADKLTLTLESLAGLYLEGMPTVFTLLLARSTLVGTHNA